MLITPFRGTINPGGATNAPLQSSFAPNITGMVGGPMLGAFRGQPYRPPAQGSVAGNVVAGTANRNPQGPPLGPTNFKATLGRR